MIEKNMMQKFFSTLLAVCGMIFGGSTTALSQSEVMAWGNIIAIRVQGEPMEFESSLRLADPDWTYIQSTGKERQRPEYIREGNTQTVATALGQVAFTQRVTDSGEGKSDIALTVSANERIHTGGAWFCLELPENRYGAGTVAFDRGSVSISELAAAPASSYKRYKGRTITVEGRERTLKLEFPSSVTAFVGRAGSGPATIWVSLAPAGSIAKGRTWRQSLTLTAGGAIDREAVEVVIDRNRPGRLFEGLGGNFRLQNPTADPKVIDYCLENLRVAWGRVEMPWRTWQEDENTDPLAVARRGEANPRVLAAMQMGQRLKAIGMPVVVSAWFPPLWAIDGDPASYTQRGGVRAFRLDPEKNDAIYRSLADYLVYMKEAYGVEADFYSFNESDIGIDVLHTPEEHAVFIKDFGAYLASRGLSTKLLLGDNSDATTFDFIIPGMNDPECRPYIGAVSFHSWRGCDDETLRRWGDAARRLNVPLIIGEGSTDAAAHRYPHIFKESSFALYEINLYVRICALAQPLSILQWQLTSDYSLLLGDGILRAEGPLSPTQRFWNLKQLASTPEESFALPFESSKEQVNCAAFGNIARDEYTLHMVNNGSARTAVIKGLPAETGKAKVWVTTADLNMQEVQDVQRTADGTLTFPLPAASFATAIVTAN
ncbi:MAG: hypothetical protein LBV32_02665 [Tannerellaceae bacterium]|jgi:hypothetical protein|nr:hypothetical protein [Tannerellaceae bacterium]